MISSHYLKHNVNTECFAEQTCKSQDLQNRFNKKGWIRNLLKNKKNKVSNKETYASEDILRLKKFSVLDFFAKSFKKSLFFMNRISGSSFNISTDIVRSECSGIKNEFFFSKKLMKDYLFFLLALKQRDSDQFFSNRHYLSQNAKHKNKYGLLLNKTCCNSLKLIENDQKKDLYLPKKLYPSSYCIKLWLTFYIPNIIRWFVYMWILFVITFALYELNRVLNMIEMGFNTWSNIIHSFVHSGVWIYNKVFS
ncbi:uncharacterized protein T551_01939 [Pneumocystis jirovecii RU7]|uniref:Uncharacterized protein n=1 Tax=Pneumocystis jirovecii (strain RU7) TaxID=1408657 RepID=A0A0W4ZNR0_PNEJ7|nr:uncharacterized protein T551_01939 [Pneumocystis jirovecii RU7]KTW29995.1 hypothetical protein T551_01939 [Pneumocystis jirovecii RU7]